MLPFLHTLKSRKINNKDEDKMIQESNILSLLNKKFEAFMTTNKPLIDEALKEITQTKHDKYNLLFKEKKKKRPNHLTINKSKGSPHMCGETPVCTPTSASISYHNATRSMPHISDLDATVFKSMEKDNKEKKPSKSFFIPPLQLKILNNNS